MGGWRSDNGWLAFPFLYENWKQISTLEKGVEEVALLWSYEEREKRCGSFEKYVRKTILIFLRIIVVK